MNTQNDCETRLETHVLRFASPIGELHLVAVGAALCAVILPNGEPPVGARETPEHPVLREAARQLREYFDGGRRSFELPLSPRGTAFQRDVWKRLQAIPFGAVRSYGELARELGHPSASRAVGAANGRNPLAVVVPCHRVIGSDGSLTGYAGGIGVKRWLLAHEGGCAAEQASHPLLPVPLL